MDWNHRLKDEYSELNERYERLENFIDDIDEGKVIDESSVSQVGLLEIQAHIMEAYINVLAERAHLAGILL